MDKKKLENVTIDTEGEEQIQNPEVNMEGPDEAPGIGYEIVIGSE